MNYRVWLVARGRFRGNYPGRPGKTGWATIVPISRAEDAPAELDTSMFESIEEVVVRYHRG